MLHHHLMNTHNDNKLHSQLKQLFAYAQQDGFTQSFQVHPYTDRVGNLIYCKVRLTHATRKNKLGKPEKMVRACHFDQSQNRWQMKEPTFGDGQKPLYQLHLLDAAPTVWIFEGEQKAELATSLGYTSTTTGASSSVNAHDLTPLVGKSCILWRDNDAAGKKWLYDFVIGLGQLEQTTGRAINVQAVNVDALHLPEKGDIVDYLAGKSADEATALMANLPMMTDSELQALLAAQAAPSTSTATTAPPTTSHSADDDADAYEWGEIAPLDEPAQDNSAPYPLDAFGKELGTVIKDISHKAQVPHAITGHCVLGALSAVCQRLVNAPFLDSHQPCSLFLVSEFPSGQGKSYARNLATKALKEYSKEQGLQYREDLQAWLDLSPKDKINQPKPIDKNFMADDATIEAVTDRFILEHQRDIYWSSDEAGQFFGGYSMKSDTATASVSSLVKLWDDGSVSKLRSKRGKNAQDFTAAWDVRLTLDLMGQRAILEPALTDATLNGQGFLARCLLVCPSSLQGQRDFNSPERLAENGDTWAMTKFYEKCDELLLKGASGSMLTNMDYADRAALQRIADYMQEVENAQRIGGKYRHIPAFAGRMGQNASRIACLFARFENAPAVSVAHIERGIQIVDYCISERLRYEEINDGNQSDVQMLLEWLLKRQVQHKGEPIELREIRQFAPNRLRQQDAHYPLLQLLEETNHLRITTQGKSRQIELNPALLSAKTSTKA